MCTLNGIHVCIYGRDGPPGGPYNSARGGSMQFHLGPTFGEVGVMLFFWIGLGLAGLPSGSHSGSQGEISPRIGPCKAKLRPNSGNFEAKRVPKNLLEPVPNFCPKFFPKWGQLLAPNPNPNPILKLSTHSPQINIYAHIHSHNFVFQDGVELTVWFRI